MDLSRKSSAIGGDKRPHAQKTIPRASEIFVLGIEERQQVVDRPVLINGDKEREVAGEQGAAKFSRHTIFPQDRIQCVLVCGV